ncbi:hypothetical protein BH10BDE1_BH10BDE1_03060 [soil metagenome]
MKQTRFVYLTAHLVKVLFTALAVVGAVSFSASRASAADLFRSEDQQAKQQFKDDIDEEYGYRTRIEPEAAAWAKDLMFMYRWNAMYPANTIGLRPAPEDQNQLRTRMHGEFAWLLITGHGVLATFDFSHAEQTLAGSTSRLVGALTRSKSFWLEVRNQCIEIEKIKKEKGLIAQDALTVGDCAKALKRDMTITQLVGSNVSLFVGGGIVLNIGKKLFQRFASKWFVARVLPLIPAFARTKWALAGLSAAIIIVPASFVVASISEERKTNEVFLEDVQTSLKQNSEESDRASVMFAKGLATEREVLQLAQWISQNVPKSSSTAVDEEAAAHFTMNLKLIGPNYEFLIAKRTEVEARRDALEIELGKIPGISARLLTLAEERKHGALNLEDAKLFRRAQYLAALRLVLKTLPLL